MSKPTTFITLGTAGGPVPKKDRASPAHAIFHEGRPILVDCGEGAMRQLMRVGVDFRQLHEIILTHHHFDHIGSLFNCIGINMMLQRQQPLNIYGPKGTRQIVESLAAACDVSWEIGFGIAEQKLPHPRDFIQVREIEPGDVIEIDEIKVTCCENTHYRSEDKFGQDGSISLSLRFDAPDRSIVFTGDTGPCRNLEEFGKGAQLLVGEVVDVERTVEKIRQNSPYMSDERVQMMTQHMAEHHLQPEQLGELASQIGAEHVVAVHITLDSITDEMKADYAAKIASTFSGKVTISEDLDCF